MNGRYLSVAFEPTRLLPTLIMVTPDVEPKNTYKGHTLYRFFLGPLPERVVSSAQHLVTNPVHRPRGFFSFTQAQQTSSEEAEEPIEELIGQYAYAFYLKLGGSEEDWNEEQEIHVKKEMLRRWKESAWGRLWRRRKESPNTAHARWVLPNDAGFFQVGEFLGLNTHAEPASRGSRLTPASGSSARAGPPTSPVYSSATARDSFVTARSHVSPEPETEPPRSSSLPPIASISSNGSYGIHAVTSSTNLIPVNEGDRPSERHRTRTGPTDAVPSLKPALRVRALTQAKSDSAIDGTTSATFDLSGSGKGKTKKAVRLPSDPLHYTIPAPPPVSPGEVLERTGSELQGTSAAREEQLRVRATNSAPASSLEIPDEYDDAKMKGETILPSCHPHLSVSPFRQDGSSHRLL